MPAKHLHMVLGALIIQMELGCSDAMLVQHIKENPYLQYFAGLSGYQMEAPFSPSALVEFRKGMGDEKLIEINEMIIRIQLGEE